MVTSPKQLFGTFGAQRLWQLNLQSTHEGLKTKETKKEKKKKQKIIRQRKRGTKYSDLKRKTIHLRHDGCQAPVTGA